MNVIKGKRTLGLVALSICLVTICATILYFSTGIETSQRSVVVTDLQESAEGYRMITLGQDYDGGPLSFRCVGASLENAIKTLQRFGVIKSRWVVNEQALPEGIWDIDLGEGEFETKEKVRDAFFAWVALHFEIELKEETVRQEVLFCEFPTDSKSVIKSALTESSKRTTSVNGDFGMQFDGVTSSEFCEWLREYTRKPVASSPDAQPDQRYDFFLSCFPPHPESIYAGLKTLGIRLQPGVADIDAVVVVATD